MYCIHCPVCTVMHSIMYCLYCAASTVLHSTVCAVLRALNVLFCVQHSIKWHLGWGGGRGGPPMPIAKSQSIARGMP